MFLIVIGFAIVFIPGIFIIDDIMGPTYTIQDVYVYCGKNPEVLITHHGDNCSNVMNNIYGENENFTRWRIDE